MGKRVRKSSRNDWDKENMEKALHAVRQGIMGTNKASKLFKVPRTTLRRRRDGKNVDAKDETKILGSIRPVFTLEQEKELLDHVIQLQKSHYGLTKLDVRSLAFELADKNKLKHNFNVEKRLAGEDWLKGFRQRHPDISLRTPEATSAARSRAFNKPIVTKFFQCLQEQLNKYKFKPHNIYNVDETGIGTVPTKNSKLFAERGQRQVGRFSSAERGENATAVICMSAGGNFIPPMIIYPRQRLKPEMFEGAPPGTIFFGNNSGWMKLELFKDWFTHFLQHSKPSEEDPVMLILDGHVSHTKNLQVINMARENNVIMVCLPPHCTHKLQPLDVAFMYPLSRYYDNELEKWTNNHPGRVVTMYQVASIFGEAYLRAATPQNALSGFKKCGIYPFNPDVFQDWEFAAADVTDQPEEILANCDHPQENVPDEILADREHQENVIDEIRRDCATESQEAGVEDKLESNLNTSHKSFVVSPIAVKPLPKMAERRSQRRKPNCTILTSSPHKKFLEESEKKKMEKERKNAVKVKKSKKKQSKKIQKVGKPSCSKDKENDVECLFCGENFINSVSGEKWVQCIFCRKWLHEECANTETENVICDFCK